ncbi:MAG: hypothetical protein O7198_00005 [Wolbachia endosymbiont of Nomada marshamella]|nr:hypothetical protein [Wolbachia endosymbiont of Nomada marshamella]
MPLQIGSLTIDSSVILAPMSGVTDYPFRSIVKKLGSVDKKYEKKEKDGSLA